MNPRPLLTLAALAFATTPDLGAQTLEEWKETLREKVRSDPMGSVVALVLGGAWLFYRAEVGHNPKVTSYYDALVYVSTNLSVGYADIFARTDAGKAIGTAIMTFGPAMSGSMFEAPAKPDEPKEATSSDIVARLDRILEALERRITP